MATVVSATNGLSECTLAGNHYQCTGIITGHDSFVTDKSIHIYDATISLSGSSGGTASSGESINLNIFSTNGKILIERSNITASGGNGGTGDGATGNADGGAGGVSTLNINADIINIVNTSLYIYGGNGGNGDGDANPSSCTYDETGIGGAGGNSNLEINGETLILNNVVFDDNSGNGGTGNSVSCTKSSSGPRVDCYAADGGASGSSYNYIYYTNLTVTGLSINGQPGNGGDADASTCSYTSGDGDGADSDSAGSHGGFLGAVFTYFEGDITSMSDIVVDYYFGTSFQSRSVERAEAPDGTTEIVTVAEEGAYATSSHIFSLITEELTFDNGTFTILGAAGYDADAGSDIDTGSTTPGTDRSEATGGDGQGFTMTIYADNLSTFINSEITVTGGTGGIQDCAARDHNSFEDCGTYSGDGGHNIFNIKNVDLNNVNITSVGGVGASDGADEGAGGNGGNNFLNNYLESSIDSNSNIVFTGGVGGIGCSTNYGICAPGKGGDAYVYNYGDFTINAVLDFNGGASGSGSICRATLYTEQGGDAAFDSNDTLRFIGANIDLNAGSDSASCAVGGNAFIDNDVYLKIYNDSNITGVGGVGAGNCESDFKGRLQIENSNYSCVAATGTAGWYGINMTQVDYRANSSITMSGSADNNINFTYIGDVQKFLIYNSTFDDTYVYWNNDSCKFTNRTPVSVGTAILNESCTAITWDSYYTDINTVSQMWYESCEQPSADIIACGAGSGSYSGLGSWTPSTAELSDDNFSTYAYSNGDTRTVSYVKPATAISSFWTGKDETGTFNIKVPDSCFDFSSTTITLYMRSNQGTKEVRWACFDGTLNVIREVTGMTNAYIYEETMNWEFGVEKPLPYSYVDYKCTANVNYPQDVIGSITANFTWFINDVENVSQTDVAITSDTDLTSTSIFKGATIGDNVSCQVIINSDGSQIVADSITNITVAAYPYNAKIDIGNDGTYEYEGVGVFNNTLADTYVKNGINVYLRDCTTSTCNVPITFSSDENATWIFNQVNSSYGVSTTVSGLFNLSLALFSSDAGIVNVNSLDFDYGIGDGDVVSFIFPLNATATQTLNATIVISNFTQDLPNNTLYFEMYPNKITSQDVEPDGQNTNTPIFTVTNNHASETVDIYVKLENDWSTMNLPCTNLTFMDAAGLTENRTIGQNYENVTGSTGEYVNESLTYDGNFSTYGSVIVDSTNPQLRYYHDIPSWFDYTKHNVTWIVKDGEGIKNLTIPDACLDEFRQKKLELFYSSPFIFAGFEATYWGCFINDTNTVFVNDTGFGSGNSKVYENTVIFNGADISTVINTTSQLYCDDIQPGNDCELWGYQDFDCTYAQVVNAVYEPNFIFDAICSDCVITTGAFD